MAEIAVGTADESPKLVQIDECAGEPHYGQGGQVSVQAAAGLGHLWPAISDGL